MYSVSYSNVSYSNAGGAGQCIFCSPTKSTFSPISSLFRQVGSLFPQKGYDFPLQIGDMSSMIVLLQPAWDISFFLEIGTLQELSHAEGPFWAHLSTQPHLETWSLSLLQWSNSLIYSPTSLGQVRSNHCCQISSIIKNRPQNILGGESDYFNYFDWLATNRPTLMLLIILISWSSSANLKQSLCLFLFCSFLGKRPLERHFSPLKLFKESFLGKNMCLHLTNGRRSDHGSSAR